MTTPRLHPADQGPDPDQVTLRIVQAGETTVTVDRAAYDESAAGDGGDLGYLLATAPARLPLHTYAVGPDGAIADIGPDPDETEPIHLHFGLSYATHLVMPRTLLQSMPAEWQRQFVHLLDQFDTAFHHVEQPEGYDVTAAVEKEVSDLTDGERKRLGIAEDWYGGEEPPAGLDAQDLAEWQNVHEDPGGPVYTDADGDELEADSRVMLPVTDPLPHYNRGRTRITPRLVGEA